MLLLIVVALFSCALNRISAITATGNSTTTETTHNNHSSSHLDDILCVASVLSKSDHFSINISSLPINDTLKCDLYCDHVYQDMYFTPGAQSRINSIQIMVCTAALLLSIVLCVHMTCPHRAKRARKYSNSVLKSQSHENNTNSKRSLSVNQALSFNSSCVSIS
eukprot:88132_1